jgi:hypothetical protein
MATTPINPVNLISAVRSCDREHWKNTGKWFAYTVGCGFLPIIIGMLLVFVISTKHLDWYDFVVHGELAIYSAVLIASSTRLIAKDTDTFPFVHREMFTLTAILFLVVCVALYSAVKAALLLSLQGTINDPFIARVSVGLLILSLAFSFLVFLLDQQRISPNVRGIIRHQEDALRDAFDKLGGAQ